MPDQVVALSELTHKNLIEVGAGRPRSVLIEYPELPILRVADVLDGRIESPLKVSVPSGDQRIVGSKISKPGDIVLTVKGTVGRVALIPSEAVTFAYSPQLCYFRPAVNGPLRSRYLYYWFKSTEFWNQANALKGQTDMADYLSLSDVETLKIGIPSLDMQDGIIEVLGALDDKIQAEDLISSAALSLAGYFFEQGSTGIDFGPETFDSVAFVYGGGTPRTSDKNYWDGGIAWATPTDVTALSSPYLFETSRAITDEGLANCASQLYPVGSIFMTSRATIGAFAVTQIPAAVNQGFIVVVPPRNELRWWLFHEMRSRVDEMLSLANGSTFLELSRKNFKAMPVRVASEDVIKRFDAKVGPLHQRAAKAAQESRALAELRDALLPKLMSGEIRVRDAERVVEDVTL